MHCHDDAPENDAPESDAPENNVEPRQQVGGDEVLDDEPAVAIEGLPDLLPIEMGPAEVGTGAEALQLGHVGSRGWRPEASAEPPDSVVVLELDRRMDAEPPAQWNHERYVFSNRPGIRSGESPIQRSSICRTAPPTSRRWTQPA